MGPRNHVLDGFQIPKQIGPHSARFSEIRKTDTQTDAATLYYNIESLLRCTQQKSQYPRNATLNTSNKVQNTVGLNRFAFFVTRYIFSGECRIWKRGS